MSNVAKFLIVLNLILAGVFVGSAANFLGQKDHVQERLELNLKIETEKLVAAKTEVDTLKKSNTSIQSENSNLRTQIDVARQASSDAERANQMLSQQNTTLASNLAHATTALELLNGTLKANQDAIQNLQSERTKLTESRDTEHTARVAAEAMVANIQRQLDDETAARKSTEGAFADANSKIQSLDAELAGWKAKFPNIESTGAQPAITPGKVLAADNAMGLVVTSLGEEDGVKPGFEYVVSRGSQYVATIKVTDVQSKKSTAMVVKGMQKSPIQANDTVMNR
jgi:predicted  nucleic acid-binding Zn-ribbon protein